MKDIILKDIKLMLSDKKALMIIILMPIVITTILSFSLSDSFSDNGSNWNMNIGIVKQYNLENDINRFQDTMISFSKNYNMDDMDPSKMMQNIEKLNPEKTFFEDFLNNEELKEMITYKIYPKDEAYKLLEEKKISAIILLPENYVYDSYVNMFTIFRNNINIKVVGHPDMNYRANITEEIVKAYNNIMSSMIISKNVFMEEASNYLALDVVINGIEEVFSSFDTDINEINILQTNLEEKNHISSFAYYAAAMLAMFILFTASFGGKFLLEEKDNSTFYRIQVSGKSRNNILVGKFVMMMIIVLIQSLVMICFSNMIFKINWVNPVLVSITAILSALAVGSIGIFIASLCLNTNNYKASDAFSSVFVQILALFGGSYIPVGTMPDFIGAIGKYTPNGAVLNAYLKIMEGYGIKEILPYLIILVINAAIFSALAMIILRGGKKNVKYVNA